MWIIVNKFITNIKHDLRRIITLFAQNRALNFTGSFTFLAETIDSIQNMCIENVQKSCLHSVTSVLQHSA